MNLSTVKANAFNVSTAVSACVGGIMVYGIMSISGSGPRSEFLSLASEFERKAVQILDAFPENPVRVFELKDEMNDIVSSLPKDLVDSRLRKINWIMYEIDVELTSMKLFCETEEKEKQEIETDLKSADEFRVNRANARQLRLLQKTAELSATATHTAKLLKKMDTFIKESTR